MQGGWELGCVHISTKQPWLSHVCLCRPAFQQGMTAPHVYDMTVFLLWCTLLCCERKLTVRRKNFCGRARPAGAGGWRGGGWEAVISKSGQPGQAAAVKASYAVTCGSLSDVTSLSRRKKDVNRRNEGYNLEE
jgi:hypothetical protein